MMRKKLLATREFGVVATRYRAQERHGWHTDQFSRLSFLLRGEYREEGPSGSVRVSLGDVVLKSFQAPHEDAFGPDGALLVSLEYYGDDPFVSIGDCVWRKRSEANAMRHAMALLEAAVAGDSAGVMAAGSDLAIHAEDGGAKRSSRSPKWLEHLKDELGEVGLALVNVADRARAAGVHPAYASSLFRRSYGVSITEYAQAQRVRRSLSLLAGCKLALSEVAIEAGFYDQSHMSRVFRRYTGQTPAGYRALSAAAAC